MLWKVPCRSGLVVDGWDGAVEAGMTTGSD